MSISNNVHAELSNCTNSDVGSIRIEVCDDSVADQWDKFVAACPEATFFHLYTWREVIEKSFGHKMLYLCAKRDEIITGILPLGRIKSILFGDSLISVPFSVYGGVVATDELSRNLLVDHANRLATEMNVDYLEYRNVTKHSDELKNKELYVTFRKELESDHDSNMKAIPRKQRAMVRKGIDAGLQCDHDGDIDSFFYAYSTSVRNLGTPVFSKKFFSIIKKLFSEMCEITIIKKNNTVLSAVMSFYFKDEVLPYYGGGTEMARKYKANDFMYWALMCRATDKGCKIYDFGRSKIGTGSYSFKKNWGFTPEPLYYQYFMVNKKDLPDVNPLNPKYSLFIKAWKKLPLPIANVIGPVLSRSLG